MSFRDRGLEFVVFDADGEEVDVISPLNWYYVYPSGVIEVDDAQFCHDVEIPEGGRFEVRMR